MQAWLFHKEIIFSLQNNLLNLFFSYYVLQTMPDVSVKSE